MKQIISFLLLSTISFAAITFDFAGEKRDLPGTDYSQVINDSIVNNISRMNKTDNKMVFRIGKEEIDKLLEVKKEQSNIPKGVADSETVRSDGETNMFLKSFIQNTYDSNGIYVGKLNILAGGISKGYILKTYMILDKAEQKSYKIVEFERVNFLDDFIEIYANFYKERRENPLLLLSPNRYIENYLSIIDNHLGGSLKSKKESYEENGNEIHRFFTSYNFPSNPNFGLYKIVRDDALNIALTSEEIKELAKNKLKNIAGSLGSRPSLFQNDGLIINYATTTKENISQKEYYSDYMDILNTHMSFAVTIMTKHNIRNGFFLVDGMPGYAETDKSTSSPIAHVATYRQSCAKKVLKKCVKHRHHFDGGYLYDSEHLFTIQSNDYLNFNSNDYSSLLGSDVYESQRIIPTIMPFAHAISTPSVTHQGHILSHVASFTGYGNYYNGGGSKSGYLNKEDAFTNSFGEIRAGYTSNSNGCVGAECGRYKGHHVTHTKWNWWPLLALALSILIPFVADIPLMLLLLTIGFVLSINVNISNKIGNGVGGTLSINAQDVSTEINNVVVNSTGNTQLYGLLKFSSIYEELMLTQSPTDLSLVNNIYSKKAYEQTPTNVNIPYLKNPAYNTAVLLNKGWDSNKYYQRVFSGGDSAIVNHYNTRFNNDINIVPIIKGFL